MSTSSKAAQGANPPQSQKRRRSLKELNNEFNQALAAFGPPSSGARRSRSKKSGVCAPVSAPASKGNSPVLSSSRMVSFPGASSSNGSPAKKTSLSQGNAKKFTPSASLSADARLNRASSSNSAIGQPALVPLRRRSSQKVPPAPVMSSEKSPPMSEKLGRLLNVLAEEKATRERKEAAARAKREKALSTGGLCSKPAVSNKRISHCRCGKCKAAPKWKISSARPSPRPNIQVTAGKAGAVGGAGGGAASSSSAAAAPGLEDAFMLDISLDDSQDQSGPLGDEDHGAGASAGGAMTGGGAPAKGQGSPSSRRASSRASVPGGLKRSSGAENVVVSLSDDDSDEDHVPPAEEEPPAKRRKPNSTGSSKAAPSSSKAASRNSTGSPSPKAAPPKPSPKAAPPKPSPKAKAAATKPCKAAPGGKKLLLPPWKI